MATILQSNMQSAPIVATTRQGTATVLWDTADPPVQPVTLPAANGNVTWRFELTIGAAVFSFLIDSRGGTGRVIYEFSTEYDPAGEYIPNAPSLRTHFEPLSFTNVSASGNFEDWVVGTAADTSEDNAIILTVLNGVGATVAEMTIRFYLTARAGTAPGDPALPTVPKPACEVTASTADKIIVARTVRSLGHRLVNQ